jgi:hypothetical protein
VGTLRDRTGQVFHRLTAIERGPNTAPVRGARNGVTQWWCVCTCGEKVLVRTGNLVSGNTRSCGCLPRERWQSTGL